MASGSTRANTAVPAVPGRRVAGSTRTHPRAAGGSAATRAARPAPSHGDKPSDGRRITARGQATRDRIVAAAAELMYVRGVNAVTLDDVRAATGTSKSQLYKHFAGKPELIRAVVAYRAEHILAREEQRLARLKSMRGLRRWRDTLIQAAALQRGAYGCALGSMAVELSDQDEPSRSALSKHFAAWERLLADGLSRMRDDGTLTQDADPDALAVGLMAALQGGYLLAQADHDVTPMATALDMALAHIESLTARTHSAGVPVARRPPAVSAAKLLSARDTGTEILDARSADDFASAHLRASINIGPVDSGSSTAAALCDTRAPVAVIVYPGEGASVTQRLAELGFTDVIGFYPLAAGSAFPAKLAASVQRSPRTSPHKLEQLLAAGAVTVVDVRDSSDRGSGSIPRAIEIPLADLPNGVNRIPIDKPIVVHCAAGRRSSAAASWLRAHGVTDVSDLAGGYGQWQRRTRRKTSAKH